MAFKFIEASSSDCPPERKVIPGRAGTMDLERDLTVYHAISSGLALVGQVAPGVTIFGFNNNPSIKRFWLNNSDITAAKTFSDTWAQTSMV